MRNARRLRVGRLAIGASLAVGALVSLLLFSREVRRSGVPAAAVALSGLAVVAALWGVRDSRLRKQLAQTLASLESIETELKAGEQRYRALVENLHDVVCEVDPAGTFLYLSPNFREVMGHDPLAWVGRNLAEIIHPNDVDRAMTALRDGTALIGGRVALRFRHADGHWGWLEAYAGQCRTVSPKARTVVICRDVTELRRANEELRRSEHNYRGLFEHALDPIVVFRPEDQVVLDVNRRACEVYGFDRSEFFGMSLESISTDTPRVKEHITMTLVKGEDYFFETVQRRRDGSEIVVEASASVVDYNGELAILSIIRDVTERRRAEEATRLLQQAVELAPIGVTLSDSAGRIMYVNPAQAKMYGRPTEDLRGKVVSELAPPQLRGEEGPRNLSNWNGRTRESLNARADGTVFPVSLTSIVVRGDSGEPVGVVAMAEDITERRLAEEALRKSREELRALARHLQRVREEERARIARDIHDELGQGLTCLRMDLAWLGGHLPRRAATDLLGKIKSMTAVLDDNVAVLQRLIKELRPPLLDDLGLGPAIEWLTKDFEARTGIKFKLDIREGDVQVGHEMATAVFRIVQESLTNIAKHSGATAGRVSLKVTAGSLILEVSDNGKGIGEIEAGGQVSFGLVGIRERVAALGGNVMIKGRRGSGTVVGVEIPVGREG
jgi:PAS domain S-box-containing protein